MDAHATHDISNWDLFISHAFEDKEEFVEPLASALSAFGVKVWYDKYTLKPGDSLSRSIDQGLARSNFGLVVLSPAFIAKRWPEYELRGLTAREMAGGKIILPIWYKISHAEVLQFSPPLADKLAIQAAGKTAIQIAVEVIRQIRPDLFTKIMRRIALYEAIGRGRSESIPVEDLKPSPIQHETLPPELIGRIRLIRASLLGAYTHSMRFWVDGFPAGRSSFNRDLICERVAAVYHEYCAMAGNLTNEQRDEVFAIVSSLWIGDQERVEKHGKALPGGALAIIRELYASREPAYDIKEEFDKVEEQDRAVAAGRRNLDREYFPDIPESLVRQLMGTQKSTTREAGE